MLSSLAKLKESDYITVLTAQTAKISDFIVQRVLWGLSVLHCSMPWVDQNKVENFMTITTSASMYISTPKKGQLNSKWIYEVTVSSKIPTKNYKDSLEVY